MLYSGRYSLDDLRQDILVEVIRITPITTKCAKILEGVEDLGQGD